MYEQKDTVMDPANEQNIDMYITQSHITHLSKCHSNATDSVFMRSTLQRREHGTINLLLIVIHDIFASLLIHTFLADSVEHQA